MRRSCCASVETRLPPRAGKATWWLILLLAMIATVLCYRLFTKTYDRELHQAVSKNLQEIFPNASVYVGFVSRGNHGTIVANDVRLAHNTQPRKPVFNAQRVEIRGNLELSDWVQDALSVTHVDLHGAQITLWPDDEQRWSWESMIPRKKKNRVPPSIKLHDLIVVLRKSADINSPSLTLHHISGTIEPAEPVSHPTLGIPPGQINTLGTLQAQTSATALRSLNDPPSAEPNLSIRLVGRSTGTIEQFQVSALVSQSQKSWMATGKLERLRFSPALLNRLPDHLSNYFSQLQSLECDANAAFEIMCAANQPAEFKVKGDLTAGRLRDPRLPYPLENIQSAFSCKNAQIQLRNMHAESGGAQIELSADISGLRLDSPMTILAQANNVELDQRLYQSLPPKLREQWEKLQLAGRASGSIRLLFDGQKWTPSLKVTCEGVSLRPWLFPYPLTGVRGVVEYQDRRIESAQLVANCGGQQISGQFSLQQVQQEWLGRLDCRMHGSVSIDEPLISALTPQDQATNGAETFIRSLHPSGSIALTQASFFRASLADTWHRTIDASIYNGSITYDGFRYPIDGIRGRFVGQDDHWWLDQFEGRNDSGRIKCSGAWLSGTEANTPFDLRFEAFSVPTEEELKLALPSEARFVWDELRPTGSVDQVTVRILRPEPNSSVHTVVKISEDSSTNLTSNRSLRVRPKTFPYPLTDVDCEIEYTPGQVVIREASGVNGSSRLSLTGICQPIPDGRWKASVTWLPQTRLIVESELLKALPKSIRQSLVRVDFRGPISVLGKSEMLFANQAESKLETSWDCQVAVEDGQLADGKNIGALRGTVWMQGQSDGTQINASGRVSMDALTVRGIPVTRLEGPFALLGSNLYFGSRVSDASLERSTGQAEDMTANALSGKLIISGFGKLDSGKFTVNAGLRSAMLSLLMQDLGADSQDTEAVCDADVDFNGIPWNPQTYDGEGTIHLSDAKLYQLPFMIRLMRVASVNAQDDSAFDTADIRFQIDGDRIPLQVACDGEVLRLRGDGWTNLRRELKLDLYSYIGRRNPISATFSPLLADSRYATFMLIEVNGTLDNPSMQRRAFPQLEASIGQMFPELAESRRANPLLPWRK